jgi:hypothetical protein
MEKSRIGWMKRIVGYISGQSPVEWVKALRSVTEQPYLCLAG